MTDRPTGGPGSRRRVAYVINSVEGGGAAFPVPKVIAALSARGLDATVLALTPRDARALPAIAAAGIPHVVRDGGTRDHAAAFAWLSARVAALDADLIWTSLTRATLLGQLVGLRQRRPVVSWQHAAYLKPANLRLLRTLQPLSKLWIADSPSIAALTAARLHVPPARLATWPLFAADAAAPQAAPWQPGEPVRLISLGRLHPVKGYDVLLAALARLPDGLPPWTLEVAGEGAERAGLEARAAALGVPARFIGFAEPRGFLARGHLYLQPSRGEGLGVAAHEAMQAALPVVASAVGELALSVVPATGWTVPPADPDALAAALTAALRAPERLAAMGAAGRARVLDRFGPAAFEAGAHDVVGRLGVDARVS